MVRIFYGIAAVLLGGAALASFVWPPAAWSFVVLVPLFLLGVADALQTRRAVRRNFPVIGNLRYLMEMVRPEISQYFIESNTDGTPFSREVRSIVYQRAKRELATVPFGTQRDVYQVGAEWISHSLEAAHHDGPPPRVRIGGPETSKPYDASLLNISAMSFGSLSSHAVEALNRGAKLGGFCHNTGEGGISPHHLVGGGDLCWQIGTGYFGCRNGSGRFDEGAFRERARQPSVRMIEVKLSQGAKPGHGGILPAAKITPEIAAIRGVEMGADVISPPTHTAFDGPRGLLEFVARLRELSGGKPVGFKLCVGSRSELLSIVRAMRETRLFPDFMSVDGAEGGTGAAPLEFTNSVGWPLTEGLLYAHNALVGFGVRDQLRVIASAKIVTGFDMVRRKALGADLFASARAMMFALGCIQARRCHSNECPVGVATQKEGLVRGLVVEDKVPRVANYHEDTIGAFLELLGAAGLAGPEELTPHHVMRRVSPTRIESYAEIFEFLEPEELLGAHVPVRWRRALERASAAGFGAGV